MRYPLQKISANEKGKGRSKRDEPYGTYLPSVGTVGTYGAYGTHCKTLFAVFRYHPTHSSHGPYIPTVGTVGTYGTYGTHCFQGSMLSFLDFPTHNSRPSIPVFHD